MQDIFVGRTPVYNRNLGIYAYNMFFRKDNETPASYQEIINMYLDTGLETFVGQYLSNIDLSSRMLVDCENIPLPGDRFILNITADIDINDRGFEALLKLKESGFLLAIENFHGKPGFQKLLEISDVFKIDASYMEMRDVIAIKHKYRQSKLAMLAKNVSSLDAYDAYLNEGFDYFEGHFLSRTRVIKNLPLEVSKLSIMHLLSVLHHPELDVDEVEKAIMADVTVSYKLLKLINSAAFNFPSGVDSIKRAVVLLGRRSMASWASMLALSCLSDEPAEIIKIAMVRAKICELIAKKLRLKRDDQYFTAGMFSALDIIMQRTLASLINPLPLADELKEAILFNKGNIGTVVRCSLLLETSTADKLSIRGITKSELSLMYLQADQWASEIVNNT